MVNAHLSHKNKTSYFPLNPGCLIGIRDPRFIVTRTYLGRISSTIYPKQPGFFSFWVGLFFRTTNEFSPSPGFGIDARLCCIQIFGMKRLVKSFGFLVGGWTNPSEKYARQIGFIFPKVRVKRKNIWNHHLASSFRGEFFKNITKWTIQPKRNLLSCQVPRKTLLESTPWNSSKAKVKGWN